MNEQKSTLILGTPWPRNQAPMELRNVVLSAWAVSDIRDFARDSRRSVGDMLLNMLLCAIVRKLDPLHVLVGIPAGEVLRPEDVDAICALGAHVHGVTPQRFGGMLIEGWMAAAKAAAWEQVTSEAGARA